MWGVIYFAGGLQIANVTALSILLITYTNKENYQQLGDVKFILKKKIPGLAKVVLARYTYIISIKQQYFGILVTF